MRRRTPPTRPYRSLGTQVKELLVLALGYGCALSLLALDISLPAGETPCTGTSSATSADAAKDPTQPLVGTGAADAAAELQEGTGTAAALHSVYAPRQAQQERIVDPRLTRWAEKDLITRIDSTNGRQIVSMYTDSGAIGHRLLTTSAFEVYRRPNPHSK